MSEAVIYRPSEWQQRFHNTTRLGIRHVLGAGAAGPGKSTALLYDAIDQITVEHERCASPKHKHHLKWGLSKGWALHLRRTVKQLAQTIKHSKLAFPSIDPGAKWNEQATTWTFSSGYTYQFGHCKDPNSWEEFMSNEYCVAKDTPILMADGSWRAIQDVRAGELVQTLEGARRVSATFDSGVKPCVRVTTSYLGAVVGTQIHPTTHPVLLWSSDESPLEGSRGTRGSDGQAQQSGLLWQDYESLLCERPASAVKRASAITQRNGCVEFGGSPQAGSQLPAYCVPVALFEPVLGSMGDLANWPRGCRGAPESCESLTCSHLEPSRHPLGLFANPRPTAGAPLPSADRVEAGAAGGSEGAQTGSGRAIGSRCYCSVCLRLRGELPRPARVGDLGSVQPQDGAASHTPTGSLAGAQSEAPTGTSTGEPRYPHFYTGQSRVRTAGIRRGSATIEFAGFFQTFDLTVEGANHYITTTALVNSNCAIYFDELTAFNEEQYDQITSRLRSDDPVMALMLKVRSMSNPLMRRDAGDDFVIHDPHWVRRRFVDPWRDGNKVHWKKLKMGDGSIEKIGWLYMPAKLRDNPNKAFVRQYEITLREKPMHMQKALLEGDWYVTEGSFFAEYWNRELHICKPFKCPKDWRFFRSMDWGFKAFGCIHWFAMDEEETLYVIRELKFKGKLAGEVAEMVRVIEEDLGLWDKGRRCSRITGVADTQLWVKTGQSGANMGEEFRAKGVPWQAASKGAGSNQTHAANVIKRLSDHDNGTKAPGLVFFESCKYAIEGLPAIQTSLENSEEPRSGGDDHWWDCLRGDTMVTTEHGQVPIDLVRHGDLVLSTDGRFYPCEFPRLTKKNAPMLRVDLGNRQLFATPNHRVLLADGTWIRVDQIRTGMYCFAPWTQSSSAKQSKNSTVSATTCAASTSSSMGSGYTAMSGWLSTASRCLRDFTSTISTRIGRTMLPTTWSFCPAGSISSSTWSARTSPGYEKSQPKGERWRKSGTEARRGLSGIGNMSQCPSESQKSQGKPHAKSVLSRFWTRALAVLRFTAPGHAMQSSVETQESTMSSVYALPAGSASWQTGTVVPRPVHGDAVRVRGVSEALPADVYCMGVPGMGAFVAEGIVVSNCLKYGVTFASRGKSGIPEVRKLRQPWEEDDEVAQPARRGRHGYGQELC